MRLVKSILLATTLLAAPAQAATFNLDPYLRSVVIEGLPIQQFPPNLPISATIGISLHVDVNAGPPVPTPGWQPGLGIPPFTPAYWNGLFRAGIGGLGRDSPVALMGQCITSPCGPVVFGGTGASFTLTIFDHPEFLHTLTWELFLESGPGGPGSQLISLNPHLTLSLPDGLYPTPLPAALPLFAAGLGLLGWLGWRRRSSSPSTS